MEFWDRVKVEIRRQNTTQDWVAGKAGIIVGSFRGWIAKDRLPDASQAHAIAGALGVTVEYLVTGTDSTDPWLREHRQVLEDLKILAPEILVLMEAQIHAAAELRRVELGKASASTGAS
jgi:transcriptional regulator with XRE-family HTH domain